MEFRRRGGDCDHGLAAYGGLTSNTFTVRKNIAPLGL